MNLYKFSISSWVSFDNLCLSKNWFILPKLSNLLAQICLLHFLILLFKCGICSDVPLIFRLLKMYLPLFIFFLYLISPSWSLSILLIFFFKETALVLLIFIYCLSDFYFIDFLPYLYHLFLLVLSLYWSSFLDS